MLPHDELWHYGVKGMKWGVRKTPEQRAVKSDLKSKMYKTKKPNLVAKLVIGEREMKKEYLYRAEEHQRKAARIRAKAADTRSTKMKVIDAVGSKKAFSKTLKQVGTKMDRHNMDKTIRITAGTIFLAYALDRAIGTHKTLRNVNKYIDITNPNPSPINIKPSRRDRKAAAKTTETLADWLKKNKFNVNTTSIVKY